MSPTNTIPFDLPGFRLTKVVVDGDRLVINAESTAATTNCPICNTLTTAIHSKYTRSPRDLPCCGRRVCLVLHVHRFRCSNRECQRATFAERIPQVVPCHGQRTARLTRALQQMVFEMNAEAGRRVSRYLNMMVSSDTLLRIVRQIPAPPVACVRVLGVDDWAMRKGRRYGTILVNLEQRHVIDLLPDRTAATLAAWLKDHSEIEIVSRDRSGEYSAGITEGAPQAVQVADRWHLLKNLGGGNTTFTGAAPKGAAHGLSKCL